MARATRELKDASLLRLPRVIAAIEPVRPAQLEVHQ
jgi:hypothetical protein